MIFTSTALHLNFFRQACIRVVTKRAMKIEGGRRGWNFESVVYSSLPFMSLQFTHRIYAGIYVFFKYIDILYSYNSYNF